MKSKLVLYVITLNVSACATISTPVDFCSVYEPVPTLHCGSDIQKLGVDQNNAVYLDLCSAR